FLCLFYLFFLLFPLPPGSTLFPYTTLFRSEVERQTLLVAVDPHEMAGEPVDRRVVSAGEVTDFWTFDLDDSGAEVGQLPGGEWSSDGLLATDYGNSRQRQVLAGDSRYGRLGGRGHRPSTTSCLSRTHTSYISLMIMHYRKAQ